MEFLHNFGIQPTLLLAQIVNFLIILFLLKKFFYRPIVKALEERKKRIAESLKNADLIDQRVQKTQEESAKIIEEAQKSTQVIISDAKKEAERISAETALEARKTIEEAKIQAQKEIEDQKIQMKKDLEKETLNLVVEVVKKVLGRNLNTNEREKLTSQAVSQITKVQ